MIPDSAFSLLLLLTSVGPGYVFLRVAERREPRQARSPFLEFAELFVIGAATTAVAAIVVLLVGELIGKLDLKEWLAEGRMYVLKDPALVLVAVSAVLVVSYLLAWAVARILYQGRPASLRPEFSIWFQVLHVDERAGTPARRFATIELRDGRRVAGYVHAYTVDAEAENRELALESPIFAQSAAGTPKILIPDRYLIVPATEIVYVSVQVQ